MNFFKNRLNQILKKNRFFLKGAWIWILIFLPSTFVARLLPMDFHMPLVFQSGFLSQGEILMECFPGGCDAFGRNVLLLTLFSAANSLAIGAVSVLILSLVSIISLYFGLLGHSKVQTAVNSGFEFLQIFPGLIISLSLAAIMGPGWYTLCLSLILNGVPGLYRFLFLQARPILRKTYIEVSQSMGASRWFIFKRHLLPEILAAWRWKFPGLIAHSLLLEATLSYLGIGAVLGSNTWGTLLSQAKDYLLEYPSIALLSGLPLLLTVLSLLIISEPQIWNLKPSPHTLAQRKKMPLPT